jgi:hypothetical protein
MIDRIQSALGRADEMHIARGLTWYANANHEVRRMAAITGQSEETVAAIIATLSPATNWERNLLEAESLLTDSGINYSTYPQQVVKARQILADRSGIDACTGMKVRSFASNLMLDPSHVTIDRHMLTALAYEEYLTPKRYTAIADAFRAVATETPYHAYQLQAIIWLAERETKQKAKGKGAGA